MTNIASNTKFNNEVVGKANDLALNTAIKHSMPISNPQLAAPTIIAIIGQLLLVIIIIHNALISVQAGRIEKMWMNIVVINFVVGNYKPKLHTSIQYSLESNFRALSGMM